MSPGVIDDQMPQVQIGDKIIINLTNGETLVGKVVSVNPESLTIIGDKNYGRWEQGVQAPDIEKLELVYVSENDNQQNRLTLMAVVLGLLGATVYWFYQGLSQLD
jgi:hypothetical protein